MAVSQNGHTKRAVIWTAVSTEEQAAEDKASLQDQEERLRERCAANGWRVVDVLTVPGASRNHHTWRDFMDTAGRAGIDAPRQLWERWERADFDVLAVWTTDRLGRRASIHSEAIGRTIGAGAIVYVGMDGTIIDDDNQLIVSTLTGLVSGMEINKLKKRREMGMRARALAGKASNGRPLRFLTVDENDTIKPDRANYQAMFDAIFQVFINERVSYTRMPSRLKELGFVRSSGERFSPNFFYDWLYTPNVWGNAAWRWSDKVAADSRQWVYDPTAPRPAGVEVAYGVSEPVWHGAQAQTMIAEMERRVLIRGKASPDGHAFTGLLICAECQTTLNYSKGTYIPAYRCFQHCRATRSDVRDCHSQSYIFERDVRAWLDTVLRGLLSGQTTIEIMPTDNSAELRALEDDICNHETKIARMLDRVYLIEGSDELLQRHTAVLLEQQAALERKRGRLAELREARQTTVLQEQRARQSLADIANLSVDALWNLPPGRQNQLLRGLLGGAVLVVEGRKRGNRGTNGQIIGVGVKA